MGLFGKAKNMAGDMADKAKDAVPDGMMDKVGDMADKITDKIPSEMDDKLVDKLKGEDKEEAETCGCDCELCMAGKHDECNSGLCKV